MPDRQNKLVRRLHAIDSLRNEIGEEDRTKEKDRERRMNSEHN
jgi:hypothetical protein